MIEELLLEIELADKNLLMQAFEQEISQKVFLSETRFIGVNVPRSERWRIVEEIGPWVIGDQNVST